MYVYLNFGDSALILVIMYWVPSSHWSNCQYISTFNISDKLHTTVFYQYLIPEQFVTSSKNTFMIYVVQVNT